MSTVTEQLKALAQRFREGQITRGEFDSLRDALLAQGSQQLAHASSRRPTSIGSYQITGDIGVGGMGRVYRGRHRTPEFADRQGGEIAIKILHRQYASRPEIMGRFEREAELGIRLDHPGIVRVHELVVDGGQIALVMELVQGQPWSELIGARTSPIPWVQVEPMVGELLDAVKYAHNQGVIHRDLKPENIIIGPDKRVKVLDFGIAKEVHSDRTQTGTGMGTIDYMAPEQYLDAKSIDQRADIYALGMTLYEILAGRLPWNEEATEFAILEAKKDGQLPPPTAYCSDIPAGVVVALMKCLRSDRNQRPADVAELCRLLETKYESRPEELVPRPTVPHSRTPVTSRGPERVLVHGDAEIITERHRWRGMLRLSTRKLSFYPNRAHRDLGAKAETIKLSHIARVYMTPVSRHLAVEDVSGKRTEFTGTPALKAYIAFSRDICSAEVGITKGAWDTLSLLMVRLFFVSFGLAMMYLLYLILEH